MLVAVLDAGFEPSSRSVRSLMGMGRAGWGQTTAPVTAGVGGVGSHSLRQAWKSFCPFPAGESGGRPGQDLETSE